MAIKAKLKAGARALGRGVKSYTKAEWERQKAISARKREERKELAKIEREAAYEEKKIQVKARARRRVKEGFQLKKLQRTSGMIDIGFGAAAGDFFGDGQPPSKKPKKGKKGKKEQPKDMFDLGF